MYVEEEDLARIFKLAQNFKLKNLLQMRLQNHKKITKLNVALTYFAIYLNETIARAHIQFSSIQALFTQHRIKEKLFMLTYTHKIIKS